VPQAQHQVDLSLEAPLLFAVAGMSAHKDCFVSAISRQKSTTPPGVEHPRACQSFSVAPPA